MYFHRMHTCLAYFYIFVHNPWGGGRTPLSKQPLQRRSVALDILAPLEKGSRSGSAAGSWHPAVEAGGPVLVVHDPRRQQVLPECSDGSPDRLPCIVSVVYVVRVWPLDLESAQWRNVEKYNKSFKLLPLVIQAHPVHLVGESAATSSHVDSCSSGSGNKHLGTKGGQAGRHNKEGEYLKSRIVIDGFSCDLRCLLREIRKWNRRSPLKRASS